MRFFLLVLLFALSLFSQNRAFSRSGGLEVLKKAARDREIKPMAKPSWVNDAAVPVATIAWLSDMHIAADPMYIGRTRILLNQLRDELKPDCTFITGDNCANGASLMKDILDGELNRPYVIIPGDNWPWDFHETFGSHVFSFDLAGLHFVFASTDAKAKGNDACAEFLQDTKDWLQQDLQDHSRMATIYVMHETLYPPLFLDAEWTEGLLKKNKQVLAAFSGHLHFDLELKRTSWTQFVCPAVGPSHRPAFKFLSVFKDHILIRSYEWDTDKRYFKVADKWQRILIPNDLQRRGTAVVANRRSMPPRAKILDQSLLKRSKEIDNGLMMFIGSYGIKSFFSK